MARGTPDFTKSVITPAQLVANDTLAHLAGATLPSPGLGPGARSLMIVPSNLVGGARNLTITGTTTGTAYVTTWPISGTVPVYTTFDSSADPQVTITITAGAQTGTLEIWALGDPVVTGSEGPTQAARPGVATLVGVNSGGTLVPLAGNSAGQLFIIGSVAVGSTLSVAPVAVAGVDGSNDVQTLTTDGGSPQRLNVAALQATVPGLKTARIFATIAANASSAVLAGVGGQTVKVYQFRGSFSAAAATTGNYAARLRSDTTSVPLAEDIQRVTQVTAVGVIVSDGDLSTDWIPGAVALPVGEGVQVFADSANPASIGVAGVLMYTQA